MDKIYRIGFDIGIGSVGWAVLENDPVTEEPIRILKFGVRTFSPNEVEKTGESTAKDRREKRGLHRRTRRKNLRLMSIKKVLCKNFNIDVEKELKKLLNADVYMLRAKALDEQVSCGELSKIILNLAKHRGFKSNRKSLKANGEDGKLLKTVESNSKFLADNGYRTVGEAIFKDKKFKAEVDGKWIYSVRNHGGDYQNCFYREDLKRELSLILSKQSEFYKSITQEFAGRVISIFDTQRNFDEGPGKPSPYKVDFNIGQCTFIETESRAAKATYTFEYFNTLSKINSLRINDAELSFDEKQELIKLVREKESISFNQVRKILNVPYRKIFNLCNYRAKNSDKTVGLSDEEKIDMFEKVNFVSMKNSYSIKKALGLNSSYENRKVIDDVAHLLSTCKSDAKIGENLPTYENLKNLNEVQKQAIFQLNFDKFGSLSIKAMEKIIPFLEQGQRYDVACKSAGFNHSSFGFEKQKYLKGEKIDERIKDITSPVVKRAVNQTLKILNSIIKEFGSPQMVNIELARELSKNFKDRREYADNQQKNREQNEKAAEALGAEFSLLKPTYLDVLKKKLYDEQNGKCIYSGKQIELQRVFHDNNYVQIDHILPISRSFDDSYNNKVLVLSAENQNKGNRTPYEYFGNDENRWREFSARVNCLQNRKKIQNLLKENFGEEQEKEFTNRNLNDTRYMSRFLLNLMQDYLLMTPSKKHKVVVRSVSGSITSYLRKFWGISKIRDDGDIHHCVDAAVIATVSNGTIQKITEFNKIKEKYEFDEKYKKFIDRQSGAVLSEEELSNMASCGMDLLSKKLPPPYPEFVRELELRSKVFYKDFKYSESEKFELLKLGYQEEELSDIKPVFISKMKIVKKTGAIHKETMMSDREYDETKNLIKSVSIYDLKLKQQQEKVSLKDDKYPEFVIENYYRPKDDRLLYLKLKEYLVENGKIPNTVVFHKPKSDGSDGPIVKKVKVYEKTTSIVKTKNGAAANGGMYRVDVYKKGKGYYLCPVYYSDVYAKKLPNKLIAIGKEWIDIDDSFEFQFSLYQNDLILITSKKPMVMSKVNKNNPLSKKPDTFENDKLLVYYTGTGISGASISIISHDKCYKIDSLGVKNLLSIEKMYVDNLGNVYHAPKEERKEL